MSLTSLLQGYMNEYVDMIDYLKVIIFVYDDKKYAIIILARIWVISLCIDIILETSTA